jgi:hypothetical protein
VKKVLIISYFFPPSGFVGGERVSAWAEHLQDFGYYPIVITRNWKEGNEENEIIDHLKYAEVHSIRDNNTFQSKIRNYTIFRPISRLLTLIEIIGSNFSIEFLHYRSMYHHARKILQSDPEIKYLIISGRPFESFSFGHRLQKEFNLKWLPDYRDEWTTNSVLRASSYMTRLFLRLNRRSERLWTSSACSFITVSEDLKSNIGKFINKPGIVVRNGYDGSLLNKKLQPYQNKFVITYSGTVYRHQQIEPIFEVLKNIQNTLNLDIEINFIGSSIDVEQETRLRKLSSELTNVIMHPRLSKKEHNEIILKSDILLLTAYIDINHWLPAKIFEYYSSSIPILLFPSDNGAMKKFIQENNCGFTPINEGECKETIVELIISKQSSLKLLKYEPSIEFSRMFQTKILAEYLNSL